MQNHKKGNSLVGHILGWKLWTYRGKILNLRHYVLGILGIWRNKKKNICYAENKFYCYKGWIFPLVIWSLVRMRPKLSSIKFLLSNFSFFSGCIRKQVFDRFNHSISLFKIYFLCSFVKVQHFGDIVSYFSSKKSNQPRNDEYISVSRPLFFKVPIQIFHSRCNAMLLRELVIL